MQYATPEGKDTEQWQAATVAPDLTHHLVRGRALYARRFHAVQKYHAPGLAPVRDESGAYHITDCGEPAYEARFLQTWGFYDERASVQADDGWTHILPSGASLTTQRFAWCGNFQEGCSTVRFQDGGYGHIGVSGAALYGGRHLYAGDFLDGLAVVRYVDDGCCGHIDFEGRPAHGFRYLDLDVFHKGFARARDRSGWFHTLRDGSPAYEHRFAAVEPFYNGQAHCLTRTLEPVIVGPDGTVLVDLMNQALPR